MDFLFLRPWGQFSNNVSRFRRVVLYEDSWTFVAYFRNSPFYSNKVMILWHRVSTGNVFGQTRDWLVPVLGHQGWPVFDDVFALSACRRKMHMWTQWIFMLVGQWPHFWSTFHVFGVPRFIKVPSFSTDFFGMLHFMQLKWWFYDIGYQLDVFG